MPNIRNIITDKITLRNAIHRKLLEALKAKFPLKGNKYTADLKNVRVEMGEMSQNEEKTLLAKKGSKNVGVFCELVVTDNLTGKTVGQIPKHRIMSIPWLTNRNTLLVDGNEYAVVSQMRTKSGVYTRKRSNEELESAFNLAKGANFKLTLDPKTGLFKVDILNSQLHALAVLKILGAGPQDIVNVIGKDLYDENNALLTEARMDKARETLYGKLVKYKYDSNEDFSSKEEKETAIRNYFSGTELDPETTEITLGVAQKSVSAFTILLAMKKILAVHKGSDDIDERDNLEFQKIYGVEDLLAEVITKNTAGFNKLKSALDSYVPGSKEAENKLKMGFNSGILSKSLSTFLTSSSISRLPTQINPMEFLDTSSIITRLGEGAIGSERAIPFSTREVTYSSAGLIDPIAAPESFKIGIDTHATMTAAKGDDNEFYRRLRDCKTGKVDYYRPLSTYQKKVGFPDDSYKTDKDKKPNDDVVCVYKGKLTHCLRKELDYQIPDHSDLCTYTTNTIPFMNANQGNRLLMGDKHVQQAMPLLNPERRLVKSVTPDMKGGSTVSFLGSKCMPASPVEGTVVKIDDDFVYIQPSDPNDAIPEGVPTTKMRGKTVVKIDYDTNLALANKTFLENKLTVKVGDKVKRNQTIADSNFTDKGEFAAGKNLRVAYLPYKGLNHEDGVVISEATAQKMTSVHADKIFLKITRNTILDKKKYTTAFPTNFTLDQLKNIDDNGLVKKGVKVEEGDPLILAMESNMDSKLNLVLGKFHKSLMHPFRDCAEVYDMHYEAEVTESIITNTLATVILKVYKPVQIGDKLSGSYGNKGVCAAIIPTEEMPIAEDGKPVEAILTPVGVPSRINPAQILETALGKVSAKTGKEYKIENFSRPDFVEFVKDELKKNKVKDKEDLIDPVTGKKLKGVFTGVQHMYKLFKTTDTNYAARGIEGGYDQDEVPTGSGETGPKGMGGMELNALIASNTRALLRENSMLRSSKNSEFWKAFQTGGIPNFPNERRTYNRFIATLKQAGINVVREGDEVMAMPLMDEDISKMSSGEITDGKRLDARTLQPEKGGLFDNAIFGGIKGDRWGHITLAEPVVNPTLADAARSVLGLNTKEFEELCLNQGGKKVKEMLNAVDVDALMRKTEDSLREHKVSASDVDNTVKRLKCLRALKKLDKKPGDAYVLTKLPVLPPVMRPITVGATGDIMDSDANTLYRDLIMQNNACKALYKAGVDDKEKAEARAELLARVRELTGMTSPSSTGGKQRSVKGAIEFIAGDVPKTGYFYKKIIYGKMNMSGRSTISPDPTLGLDEIGLPVDTAWSMYKPFIVRKMCQMGYDSMTASDAVQERNDVAFKILQEEMEKRPIIANRAPTLWRHGILAAKPLLREGKNIRVNCIWEAGLNADYDGDAMSIHVPITDEAVEDCKKLFPSNQIFSDKTRASLLEIPKAEPVIGLYKATINVGQPMPRGAKVHRYPNVEAAWKDYFAGKLEMTDYVQIG